MVTRLAVVLDMDIKDAPDNDPDWTRTHDALRAFAPLMDLNSSNSCMFNPPWNAK